MPINITDVDAFTDPATRPAGSDVRNSASVQGPFQALANRTRWLVGMLGGISGSGEWTYKGSPRSRTVVLPLRAGQSGGAYAWGMPVEPLETSSTGYTCQSGVNFGVIYWSLNDILRSGEQITEVKALLKPASARASGQRLRVGIVRKSVDFATPATTGAVHLAYAEDDGGTALQVVTLNALSPPFGTGGAFPAQEHGVYDHYAYVRRGDADSNVDLLYGLRVTFTDPGPRNF